MTDREYPNRPIVGLGAVVFGPEGILMIKRGKPPRQGFWSLPGGAQKIGETIREGFLREVKEETGLDVEMIARADVVDSINRDDNGKARYNYSLVDAAFVVVGGSLQAGSDAMDAKWFNRIEITELELWSETVRIIDSAFTIYQNHTDLKT